jgi:PRTRC genetic system protein A
VQKLIVGHFIEKIPEDCNKSVAYVLQGDGIYERRLNKLGSFTTRLAKAEIPGLESNLVEGWDLNVPKIPASLLGTTVAFFRKVYSKHSSEVFLQFYYDTEDNEYIIHCPKQTVSAASVRYENDDLFVEENKILVFEIHSHGNMGAFFSGTDDRDEKADRFYGVIGNVNNYFPDLKLSIIVGGKRSDIEVDDLFNLDEEMYHAETFPKDWIERIKSGSVFQYQGGHEMWNEGLQGHESWHEGWQNRSRQLSMYNDSNDPALKDLTAKHDNKDYLYSKDDFVVEPKEDKEIEVPGNIGYHIHDKKHNIWWHIKEGKKFFVPEPTGHYYLYENNELWEVENGDLAEVLSIKESMEMSEQSVGDDGDIRGLSAEDWQNWKGRRF